jgi:hypothetical protein
MIPRFDLFMVEQSGEISWIGAAESLQEAELQLRMHSHQLASTKSVGQFLLLDQKTGTRRVVRAREIHEKEATDSAS